MTRIEKKGLTASILVHKNRIMHRSVALHGIILGEVPAYLHEVAVLHSLRLVQDWFKQATQKETRDIHEVVVTAGNSDTTTALRRWMGTGELTLSSAAASPLAEDLHKLQDWLHVPIRMYPYDPPVDKEPHEMPWVYRAISTQVEEFRRFQDTQPKEEGATRNRHIPRIPLTKVEIRTLLYERLERDEMLIFGLLEKIGSTSAKTLIKLKLTRQIVKDVYSRLRRDRTAQITLTEVPGATRYKYAHKGHLLQVTCPRCRRVPDSYEHMVDCDNLREQEATGADAIAYLVKLAESVVTTPPNLVFPILETSG